MRLYLPAALLTALTVAALAGCGKGTPANSSAASSANGLTPLQVFQHQQSTGQLPTLDVTTTLAGTDADGNGVRDDIDKYIAALPDTTAQKKALTQLAQSLQAALLVDTTSPSALAATSLQLHRGDSCVWQVYSTGQSGKAMTMEELTVNTLGRLTAYEKYNAARDGAVVSPLSSTACN